MHFRMFVYSYMRMNRQMCIWGRVDTVCVSVRARVCIFCYRVRVVAARLHALFASFIRAFECVMARVGV
jgi:hypothetical protein